MRNFKKLDVWIDASILAKNIYLTTSLFPTEEKFGLISQIRRCSVSIAVNIAEGCAKESVKVFSRFLEISQGSCFELESHLILASDLGFGKTTEIEDCQKGIISLQKRLHNFIKYNRLQS